MDSTKNFVDWFRSASPYIHAHRGQTFVICFGGEAVEEAGFASMIHDIGLLSSLGIRVVIVHGIRPQIEQRLQEHHIEAVYHNGLRITDEQSLGFVKQAAGTVRVEIEALLSMGLANSPMAGSRIRVASGNYVTARPMGVRDGVDYMHTGEVRRIDTEGINARLDNGEVVLISAIGYSPTGEVFNLSAQDVATSVATGLKAGKLLFLIDGEGLKNEKGQLIRQLTSNEAAGLLQTWESDTHGYLEFASAVIASRNGVKRTHLLSQQRDGVLLQELFNLDGVGTMISAVPFDQMRKAEIDDVGGILELIQPLEEEGLLVRRSREKMEIEIEHFTVLVRDGTILGTAALYPYTEEALVELACFAVHRDYHGQSIGDALLQSMENQAREMGMKTLAVLTTRTAHWFMERGFSEAVLEDLPVEKQALYNYQRNSKVFSKAL